jgi:hypothetical protein
MEIAQWNFDRVISSHFASPIQATPEDVRAAFAYLENAGQFAWTTTSDVNGLPPIACQDWELLEGLNQVIAESKLGSPAVFYYKRDCR